MSRILGLIYGIFAYIIFLATFLYAVGFIGNFIVPKSIDSPLQESLGKALLIDLALLGVFAIQHSLMARQGFKEWWTKFVPQPIERSTYVLFSSLALIVLFWQWHPIGGIVWNVQNSAGRIIILSLFALGWLLVLFSTFVINHFDLFGLRQVYMYWQGQEYEPLKFSTPGLYKVVRHPLYLGWLLAFWSTPTMAITHLIFALVTTVYILIAVRLEERDLLNYYGETYADYCRRVPMLIPFVKG